MNTPEIPKPGPLLSLHHQTRKTKIETSKCRNVENKKSRKQTSHDN